MNQSARMSVEPTLSTRAGVTLTASRAPARSFVYRRDWADDWLWVSRGTAQPNQTHKC